MSGARDEAILKNHEFGRKTVYRRCGIMKVGRLRNKQNLRLKEAAAGKEWKGGDWKDAAVQRRYL